MGLVSRIVRYETRIVHTIVNRYNGWKMNRRQVTGPWRRLSRMNGTTLVETVSLKLVQIGDDSVSQS